MGAIETYTRPADADGLADAFRAFVAGDLGLEIAEHAAIEGEPPSRTFAVEECGAFFAVIGGMATLRALTEDEDKALDEARRDGLKGRGLIEKLRTPPTPQEAARAVFMLLDDHWTLNGGWSLGATGGRSTFETPDGSTYDVHVSDCNREDGRQVAALDDDERELVEGWNKAGRPKVDWSRPRLVERFRRPRTYRELAKQIRAFCLLDLDLSPDYVSHGKEPSRHTKMAFDGLGGVFTFDGDSEPAALSCEEHDLIREIRRKGVLVADVHAHVMGDPRISKTVFAGVDVESGLIAVATPGRFRVHVRIVDRTALKGISEAGGVFSAVGIDDGVVVVVSLSEASGAEWEYAHEGGDDEDLRALRNKVLAMLEADPEVDAVAFYKGGAGGGRFEVTHRGSEGHDVHVS